MNDKTFFMVDGLEPELELRLTALVMGEASDLERDQLEMLLQERADAAAWYRQLQQLHAGLAELAAIEAEAVAEDVGFGVVAFEDVHMESSGIDSPELESSLDGDWKLSADRRQQVLAVLDGQSPNPMRAEDGTKDHAGKNIIEDGTAEKATATSKTVANDNAELPAKPLSSRRLYGRRKLWLAVVAACLLLGVGVWSLQLSVRRSHVASSLAIMKRDLAEQSVALARKSVESRSEAEVAAANAQYYLQNTTAFSASPSVSLEQQRGSEIASLGVESRNVPALPPRSGSSGTFPPAPSAAGGQGAPSIQSSSGGMGGGAAPGMGGRATSGLDRQEADFLEDRIAALGPDRLGEDAVTYSIAPTEEAARGRYAVQPPSPPFFDPPNAVWQMPALPEIRGGTALALNLPADAPPADEEALFFDFDAKKTELENWEDGEAIAGADKPFASLGEQQESIKESLRLSEEEVIESLAGQVSVPDGGTILLGGIKRTRDELAVDERTDTASQRMVRDVLFPLQLRERELSEKFGLGHPAVASIRLKIEATKQRIRALAETEAQATQPAAEPLAETATDDLASDLKTELRTAGPDGDKLSLERFSFEGLNETAAAGERFSTFSLHVSDVSFKLAMAALGRGEWPDPAKIRVEEFVNAMDYRDPLATQDEQVACQLEQAIHPYLMQRNLLRISLRTAATGRSQQQPLRLTLLLDNSGSMERPDRRQTVRRAFEALTQQLTPNDQVTLISFANTPRLLAERVSGAQLAELVQLVENLPSEGGTNLEAALRLAMEKSVEEARRAGSATGGSNRIVLMTDGAVNLGDADPQRLSELVTQMREAGIAFDAAGISAHELNDEVLEALARQGDGRYYLLDASEDAGAGFADQIAGALRPAAKNVKVQVEFNPQRVGQYKLLGFEKHLLNPEDFRNDQVDAAELAAAEAGVAVYHFEPKPDGRGDVGSVSVRYQDLSSGLMVERRWPIPYQPHTPRLEQADPRIRIASVAALFAAKLRGDAVAYGTDLKELAAMLSGLPASYSSSPRVAQLQNMIEAARQLQP